MYRVFFSPLLRYSLLASFSFIILVTFTLPGMIFSITPSSTSASMTSPRPIWILNIASTSESKTDWNAVRLGAGWTKGADPSLPSGAAALTRDTVTTPLVYDTSENASEIVFATGPDFGAVTVAIAGQTQYIDLWAAQPGTFRWQVARPWFYRLRTMTRQDVERAMFGFFALWAGLLAVAVVIRHPQRVASLMRRLTGRTFAPVGAPSAIHGTIADTYDQDVVISVKGVGKMYRIYDQPIDRLKQMLNRGRRQYGREFWAVRDISFEVRRGETMGIIGRNGSGKSTLLQMIAGTLTPTEGALQVHGRVAALLELGSGFNPEFTGRENVFLNGAVLGIGYEEMATRLDEIIAFADIGPFIDQPVKTYSSGMMVRLAFAVQASIDPDVLIIDEALAVGDVFFQQKCYRHLEKLRGRGTAILLVSHGMGDIKQFCQQALLLDRGRPLCLGRSADAVAQYLLIEQQDLLQGSRSNVTDAALVASTSFSDMEAFWPPPSAFIDTGVLPQTSNGLARCVGVAVCDAHGQPCHIFQQGEQASFFYEFEILADLQTPLCGIEIHNDKGITVHGKNSLQYADVGMLPPLLPAGSRLRCRQDVTLVIAVGEYTYEVGLATLNLEDYAMRGTYATLNLYARIMRVCHVHNVGRIIVAERGPSAESRLLHWGLADLPGACRLFVSVPGESVIAE